MISETRIQVYERSESPIRKKLRKGEHSIIIEVNDKGDIVDSDVDLMVIVGMMETINK